VLPSESCCAFFSPLVKALGPLRLALNVKKRLLARKNLKKKESSRLVKYGNLTFSKRKKTKKT
jgi:hypothetical protein